MGGAVKLVKIDVDKNPAYAGQLRVQSIPTVYAFVNGQPVDGFQGAVPDSQIKAFIDKLTGRPERTRDIDQFCRWAKESLDLGDIGGAAQAYAQVLQLEPANEKAIGGHGALSIWPAAMPIRRARPWPWPRPDSRDPEILGPSARPSTLAADGCRPTPPNLKGEGGQADPDDHAGPLRPGRGAGRRQGRLEGGRRPAFWPSSPPTATGTTRPPASSS
jgi:putative thioredoxin